MKLLVVDDSLVMRNAIARSLEAEGIAEVLFAEDGERAQRPPCASRVRARG